MTLGGFATGAELIELHDQREFVRRLQAKLTRTDLAAFRAGEARVAGGVPHEARGEIRLEFGKAVGDFGTDCHLLWLELRVWGYEKTPDVSGASFLPD